MMATQLLVVPKSIPMIFPMMNSLYFSKTGWLAGVVGGAGFKTLLSAGLHVRTPQLPDGLYLGAATVTRAGRSTRSAMV
jgi:hypothetical protein